jgi:hypothetical protein
MDFWDLVWFMLMTFVFVAYLMVMFSILTDLFRDPDASGWAKAGWILCLIFLPFLTALVYLIARGHGMTERQMQYAKAARAQQDAYIRDVAGNASPVDQVAQAKAMYDAGTISEEEFTALKKKAVA